MGENVVCCINRSSISLKFNNFLAHGSGKGMQSPLIKDYCLLQSITKNKYLSTPIFVDLDVVGILNEAMKTYSCQKGFIFDWFPKTIAQTQKPDDMLQRQSVEIGDVVNLAIDASILGLGIDEASKSDQLPMELPNFREKENIKDEENRPKKVVTLPEHLILDHILPRLPVKALLRFKSVCRDWRCTISTPEFEKSRVALSTHHQFVLLDHNEWFSPSIINNPNYLTLQEIYKCNDKDQLSSLIGCCNGLVGLCTSISRGPSKFVVLNPATRQRVEILAPDGEYFPVHLCWFGYVSSVDDYYIVAFAFLGEEFWIYSWKSGIWKRNSCILNRNTRRNERILVGKPALINDSLYWPIDMVDPYHNSGTDIVEINLVTEKYETKPRMSFFDWEYRQIAAVNLKGCLVLHTTNGAGALDVWMLRQSGDWNSWEIVYSEVLRYCRLIYYSTTGRMLVGHWKQLRCVDAHNQLLHSQEQVSTDEIKEIRQNSSNLRSNGVGDYVESMNWPFRRSEQLTELSIMHPCKRVMTSELPLSIMHRCKRAIQLAVLKITGKLATERCAS